MTDERKITLDDVIDDSSAPGIRVVVFAICFCIAMLDGFDTQAIGFVAPVISQAWQLAPDSMGVVFAAGLFGLTIGALMFGPIADIYGRKGILLISVVIFGSFALATAWAQTYHQLLLFRFLTGIGLGGAMPNVIALTSEYFPKRNRTTMVTLMFIGFPIGAVVGGLAGGKLISLFGWQSIFYVGGIAPLLMLPIILLLLPESVRYLAKKDRSSAQFASILTRFNYRPKVDAAQIDILEKDSAQVSPVRVLFTEGRALATALLWIIFFVNLLILYFLVNWLPTVMTTAGVSLERAIVAIAVLNLGGVIGGFVLSRFCDKVGPFAVLALSYMLAAVFVALIGQAVTSIPLSLATIFFAGFFVIGAQFCANAVAAQFYPTAGRSAGVGWALGVGRIGSIVGPMIGGTMIAAGLTIDRLLLFSGLPAIIAAVCVLALPFVGAARTAPATVRPSEA
ncbi:MAG: MFS transporter [Pseudorhodoplanes sp.]|jgi:AAHS family 4-hydroxybenzoate transporter-like MFS transporter|nr:MFS transporter [Pseudorhodoplanes sp.]